MHGAECAEGDGGRKKHNMPVSAEGRQNRRSKIEVIRRPLFHRNIRGISIEQGFRRLRTLGRDTSHNRMIAIISNACCAMIDIALPEGFNAQYLKCQTLAAGIQSCILVLVAPSGSSYTSPRRRMAMSLHLHTKCFRHQDGQGQVGRLQMGYLNQK